ncbi:thioredoxin domain-containing protein [Erythrobacter sp. sf7]|uniref:Thioredoxin domain-containing protein n=1 Tax=Erythrobacter fulvus TaxID=2987523 RepID=A0ABT5JPZ8_9SPHN|nr:thioredoxin domain-containing protein [Erythrobacter fulvus]MDC8754596.1 thioredoxin domain-containing protein [Erythrobacter fulvus]
MMLRSLAAIGAAMIALAAPGSAQKDLSNPGSAFAKEQPRGNWQAVVTRTERGHLIGNPDADTRLIEFVSYTCGHCAHFAVQGEPALDLTLLMPGKMAVEVRPVLRNALDLTVSLLAQCGDPAGFKDRHRAFMYAQDKWLAKFTSAPQSQQAIWARADKASRMNAASALGLADMLIKRGQSAAEVNACIMDDAAAQKLIDNGTADRLDFDIQGTPSFALDGKLLNQVHNWDALYPVLSAHFAPAPSKGLSTSD